VGTIELTEADLGSVSLSGTFTRDDGAALASSTSVIFYIENAAQPDDFVRGQEALNPSTGEFRSVVTDLPTGSSRLFLSFVISDPDEALEGVEKGPDTVFALNVFNLRCVPPLTITLEWLDAVTDVDLYVTEPGGRLVYFGRKGGVSPKGRACRHLTDALIVVLLAGVASGHGGALLSHSRSRRLNISPCPISLGLKPPHATRNSAGGRNPGQR